MRIYYLVQTIDPVIMSQSNATTANHDCLEYIPGSVMLGVMAGRHYGELAKSSQSWEAFHNGSCRFSNCYPLVDGQASLPTPMAWHQPKGSETAKGEQYIAFNHSAPDVIASTERLKPCREGFVTPSGFRANVKKDITGKTAINEYTGVAKKSHLFNYAYIEAGQSFIGWIDSDDRELLQRLQKSLGATYRMGRSRNAEFGRVRLEPLDLPTTEQTPEADDKRLVLWCLSDCELYDSQGLPTLRPQASDLHPALKGARLNRRHSFVRPFVASRFNQKRGGVDSEQAMVAMGSVLVFDLDQPVAPTTLKDIHEKGIGVNRQQGLGWVYVNPPWANLSETTADSQLFDAVAIKQTGDTTIGHSVVAGERHSPLLSWVKAKVAHQGVMERYGPLVADELLAIADDYVRARNYRHISPRSALGPSSNQWSRLFELVRQGERDWQLIAFVNKDEDANSAIKGKNAICRADNDPNGWGAEWFEDGLKVTFADAFRQRIERSIESMADNGVEFMRLLLEKLSAYDLSDYDQLNQFRSKLRKEAQS